MSIVQQQKLNSDTKLRLASTTYYVYTSTIYTTSTRNATTTTPTTTTQSRRFRRRCRPNGSCVWIKRGTSTPKHSTKSTTTNRENITTSKITTSTSTTSNTSPVPLTAKPTVISLNAECLDGNGVGYRGSIATTARGVACKPWNELDQRNKFKIR